MDGGDRLHECRHLHGHCVDGGPFCIGEDAGSSCIGRGAAEHALQGSAQGGGVGDLFPLQPLRGSGGEGLELGQLLKVSLVLDTQLGEIFVGRNGFRVGCLDSLTGLLEGAFEPKDFSVGVMSCLGRALRVAQLHSFGRQLCTEGSELRLIVVVRVVLDVPFDHLDADINCFNLLADGVGRRGRRSDKI